MCLCVCVCVCVYQVSTCKPALGHSFAAGTIDGGGDLNFTQGDLTVLLSFCCLSADSGLTSSKSDSLSLSLSVGAVEGDPFWDGIRDAILGKPSDQIQRCHHPKPILFSTGEVRTKQVTDTLTTQTCS